jgi:hypothetical protein
VEKCFSIIYGQERAVDLMIVNDDISRDDVIKSIETLFSAYKAAKRFVSKDVLLLRSVWLECDKVSVYVTQYCAHKVITFIVLTNIIMDHIVHRVPAYTRITLILSMEQNYMDFSIESMCIRKNRK